MRNLFTLSATVLTFALASCADAPVLPELPDGRGYLASTSPGDGSYPGIDPDPDPGTDPEPDPTTGSGLRVTQLQCEDAGGGGVNYTTTACLGLVEGGTGGNTYTWNVIQTWREDFANGSQIAGVCSRGTNLTVNFTVTDSSGATAAASTTFHCYWIVP